MHAALKKDLERIGNWIFRWRSYLPLLVIPILFLALRDTRIMEKKFGDSAGDYWESFAIFISFLGLGIRCIVAGYAARGTSGRNTKWQAAETLSTKGIYSITRNPLYLGNFIIVLGISLFIQVWWLALIMWIGFWLYYLLIIFAEEEFLQRKFGDQFLAWAKKTPRIIPRFRNWEKPQLPFSFKTMLRREFSTFMAIIAAFFFLEVIINFLKEGKLSVHRAWLIFFLVGLSIYWLLFILKKKTKLLNVAGR